MILADLRQNVFELQKDRCRFVVVLIDLFFRAILDSQQHLVESVVLVIPLALHIHTLPIIDILYQSSLFVNQ